MFSLAAYYLTVWNALNGKQTILYMMMYYTSIFPVLKSILLTKGKERLSKFSLYQFNYILIKINRYRNNILKPVLKTSLFVDGIKL